MSSLDSQRRARLIWVVLIWACFGLTFVLGAPQQPPEQQAAAATTATSSEPAQQQQHQQPPPPEQQQQPKLELGVYIESLCPDSRRFFVRQLVPVYRELAPIMALKIVPFGHARVLGPNRMICQHGPRECEGNRRMACVQSRARNDSETVETLGCLFAGQDTADDCIKRDLANASAQDIELCTSSDESFNMMTANEAATGRLGYVPHLTLNGKSSEDIQYEAEHDLKNFICKQYNGTLPEACKQQQQSPAQSVTQ